MNNSNNRNNKDNEKLIWEEELDKLFQNIKKSESDLLADILTIVVFNRFNARIGRLYRIVGDNDKFIQILKEFSCDTIKFPDVKEFKDALLLALIYYYKNIKFMSWKEIQAIFKYEKDIPIHYGKKLSCIDGTIKKQLATLLKETPQQDNIFEMDKD